MKWISSDHKIVLRFVLCLLNILPKVVRFPKVVLLLGLDGSLLYELLHCLLKILAVKKKKKSTTLVRGTLLVGLKMFIQSAALAAL